MIFRWRSRFGVNPKEYPFLVTALLIGKAARGRPKQKLPLVLQILLSALPGAIAVELPGDGACSHPRAAIVVPCVTPSLPRLLGCLLDQDFIPRKATVRRRELY
jgi:hypothetical protein